VGNNVKPLAHLQYENRTVAQQGGVTQAFAVGRSVTVVKLLVNGQGHKIAVKGQDE